MLKIKTRKQISVDDWDQFVSEHYGKIYSFQQQDGCKYRGIETISVPVKYPIDFKKPQKIDGEEMGVSFETWLKTDPRDKDYDRIFWNRKFYPHVSMIINDLYNKGLLEAGEYDIKIDW